MHAAADWRPVASAGLAARRTSSRRRRSRTRCEGGGRWGQTRSRRGVLAALISLCATLADAAPPYLTGVVEDAESQIIEMPRLPGMWQRQIAWLAPEGSTVAPGDIVVRLDPGDLISQAEAAQTELEEGRVQTERQRAATLLAILDADTAVVEAEAAVRLARIDAEIPAHAARRLDHDRDQLDLATAEHALERARSTLADKRDQHARSEPVTRLMVARRESDRDRLQQAIARTEIRADRSGLFIHGENPFTGAKVFAGETMPATAKIAEVASRKALRFRFWVHEADIRKLAVGSLIVVTPDALPARSVEARVDWTSKQAATRNEWSPGGYFELVAIPTGPNLEDLIPGMSLMAARQP